MTAIKICGIRGMNDLEKCRKADYLGFVVRSDSPRALDLGRAYDLMSVCDNLKVAVTTETDIEIIRRMVRYLEPDVLQLHVPLDHELLRKVSSLGVSVWGMVTMHPEAAADRTCTSYCKAMVLDSPGKRLGGNGTVHDWELSRRVRDSLYPFPVVLAGGLRAENVGEAMKAVAPFAVDVSSGVEGGHGKDPEKVDRLIEAVKRADIS